MYEWSLGVKGWLSVPDRPVVERSRNHLNVSAKICVFICENLREKHTKTRLLRAGLREISLKTHF